MYVFVIFAFEDMLTCMPAQTQARRSGGLSLSTKHNFHVMKVNMHFSRPLRLARLGILALRRKATGFQGHFRTKHHRILIVSFRLVCRFSLHNSISRQSKYAHVSLTCRRAELHSILPKRRDYSRPNSVILDSYAHIPPSYSYSGGQLNTHYQKIMFSKNHSCNDAGTVFEEIF
jgi:hypothetical protein